ncbi:phosphonopyruvate decarboxylase [Pelagicoccus sp. SDUM812002]|uniref:phosphonopyruvate decarboxylase n=1 Tax=Pelagicoccus sp. SDUM812002 TaxID=3041266 RepID=UPI00280C82B4|nr:phosphonopyruvate decarboxylase [Pelagicoccus sp. SDUM812002]MDQ8186282.1 phosphonopyruvate decarboxylase [Pelagicoccus sp. SDUM812002]
MIDLSAFYKLLKTEGVDFVTGVPDTLLNDFCLGLDTHWPNNSHVIAANEGNAIAIAAGRHLATGTIPLVYMQNSGMGNAVNPLISLTNPTVYSIPMVLLIGWRGKPGSGDWPQHQRQGELSPLLLDALEIPYQTLESNNSKCAEMASWAVRTARKNQKPTALLVSKGVLAKKEKSGFEASTQKYQLSRENAIRTIVQNATHDAIFVASTGRITRELYAIREDLGQSHDADFLNVGAMGHSLSIATGLATAEPKRQVICLDGDGAAIMHLGSLPISSNLSLPNLIHVVLNNGVHESVGGQPTVGHMANLTAIAAASGYRSLDSFVESAEELGQALRQMQNSHRPSFIEVRIQKGMRTTMPILKIIPKDQKQRIMNHLANAPKLDG